MGFLLCFNVLYFAENINQFVDPENAKNATWTSWNKPWTPKLSFWNKNIGNGNVGKRCRSISTPEIKRYSGTFRMTTHATFLFDFQKERPEHFERNPE